VFAARQCCVCELRQPLPVSLSSSHQQQPGQVLGLGQAV
jgi:hypothetical protein